MEINIIDQNYNPEIIPLVKLLNPKIDDDLLLKRQKEMFELDNYQCFGLFDNDKLIGVSSAWTSVRLYCGKQIEVDNVIINPEYQGKGCGKYFFDWLEKWSLAHGYESIELNTYVQNSGSHKFYFNLGYKILGFHFLKRIVD